MVYSAIQDPKITILDLLDPSNGGNWDNSNTSISYDPDFHTGWRNEDATNPEVTVSLNEGEGPIGGGDTGFSFVTTNGAGADWSGTIRVNCFSDRDVESSVNPKKLTWEFSEEIIRIVLDNQLSATDLRLIAPFTKIENAPDSDSDPAEFHYVQPVGYVREVSP